MDVDEEANRDNTEVLSCGANVIPSSTLIFSTFVDDNSRSAELEIEDTPCNNVVWALIRFVLLIVFTFVVEFNSVFSDTRPPVTSGELLQMMLEVRDENESTLIEMDDFPALKVTFGENDTKI